MSFLSRIFGGKGKAAGGGAAAGPSPSAARAETVAHFKAFTAAHPGCEAFVEPATRVTQTTMVVVAGSGEWTRRKVPDAAAGRSVADKLGIPVFDVNLSGYPSRMREWNEKHRG